jgi:hypothetical protein
MNSLAPLVRRAIEELQNYERTPAAKAWSVAWFASLRSRLKHALSQPERQRFEAELHAVYHSLTDSGPTASEAAPSLDLAMGSLQRHAKRIRKARS